VSKLQLYALFKICWRLDELNCMLRDW